MRRGLVALLLAVVTAMSAAGELYKWVDKDGKVHFSDKPPPADAKQSQQLAAPTKETFKESDTESAAERAARLRQAAEGIQADRQARQKNQAEISQNKARRAADCQRAQDELRQFETANRKYLVDENNQRHEPTEGQYAEWENQLRQAVAKHCG